MALTLLSALLYTLAFPVFHVWWIGFGALIPFFLALEKAQGHGKRLFLGFSLGVFLVLGTAHWLFFALVHEYEKSWTAALAFVSLFAALPYGGIFALFGLSYGLLRKNSLFFHCLVAPSLWILFEFLKAAAPFMAPWAHLGYAAVGGRWFVQVCDIAGVYGISFLMVLVNGTVFYLLKAWKSNGRISRRELLLRERAGAAVLACALLLPAFYGMARLRQFQEPGAEKTLDATVVQACFSQKERWSGMGFDHRVRVFLELSALERRGRGRVIVWPETVLNSSARVNDSFFVEIMKAIGPDALLIAGGIRKPLQGGGTFNSAFFISGKGRVTAYDKRILLPYSENTPLGRDVLGDYYTAPSRFLEGQSPLCVTTPLGAVGASICLESLYPGHVRQSVREGAHFLVNLSNDSWFNSTMPYMHLDAARMRAMENRRWMLRASNSGFSAVIAPTGELTARSVLDQRQSIQGSIQALTNLAVYSRLGDWILWVAGFIILAAIIRQTISCHHPHR